MITEPEQIRELRDSLVPNSMEYGWIEYEERVRVICLMENGSEVYCTLLKDKVPEFLAERIEAKVSDGEGE